jgi:hypothetical protein
MLGVMVIGFQACCSLNSVRCSKSLEQYQLAVHYLQQVQAVCQQHMVQEDEILMAARLRKKSPKSPAGCNPGTSEPDALQSQRVANDRHTAQGHRGDDDDDDDENVHLQFLQYFNTWRQVNGVYDLCLELAETAPLFMNVRSVRLYQDALFWKRVEDGPTPW